MRNLISMALLLAICGCGPYVFVKVEDEEGRAQRHFFVYGQFCGPGLPFDEGVGTRLSELQAHGPPADDIDAACFAHDSCFSVGGSERVCDSALSAVIEFTSDKLDELGRDDCANVTRDISIAFLGKNYAEGQTLWETTTNTIVHTPGIAIAAALYVLSRPLRWKSYYPKEPGTCNLGGSANPAQIIDLFEREYADSILNNQRQKIQISSQQEMLR